MTFKVISVGWDTQHWFKQTLESVLMQDDENFEVSIVDDHSPGNQGIDILNWVNDRRVKNDDRWIVQLNGKRKYPVRNQYEGIRSMNPQDGDVIVFLDLDGDRLAHPGVFTMLKKLYDDGTLLTYGGYVPVPNPGTTPSACRYPGDVSVRDYTRNVATRFNHLRTVKWDVLKHVPESYFKRDGEWLIRGTDYAVMVPCLELVGERYTCVHDVIMYYNHNQPHPEYLMSQEEEDGTTIPYILDLPPLERLP